jgi:hypothetical protein
MTTYNGLVDLGYKKHYRVGHGVNEFIRGNSHINGIENLWAIIKVRLSKFRGILKQVDSTHKGIPLIKILASKPESSIKAS